ncbi:MAG: helix-turn-helix domain-containing protein [Fimbriimonadia bacterium]
MTTYTTKQAALILGISERAVRKATGRGYLKHTIGEVGFGITGRIFTPEDLTQYIERRRALFGRPINSTIVAGSL